MGGEDNLPSKVVVGVHVTNQPCNESSKCLRHNEYCELVSCPHGHSPMAAHTEHAGVKSVAAVLYLGEPGSVRGHWEQGPAERDGC